MVYNSSLFCRVLTCRENDKVIIFSYPCPRIKHCLYQQFYVNKQNLFTIFTKLMYLYLCSKIPKKGVKKQLPILIVKCRPYQWKNIFQHAKKISHLFNPDHPLNFSRCACQLSNTYKTAM